ncbi:interferon-induced GTP-binding protein Mx1 isoform X2 [Perognathus longimembris pacificus]|uniref:interferon-induced GTP-binding protein Mx1 isoform X1 n=1 Tax=Perognathus longimembris pacificus TaxID=214514 RepID=UPI00201A1D0D|nr:interferon-induced GTP-binding protein Mx1 isoform X1 [Perognathus longimembris pacificus]XP_048202168.1 interferon-induced GTP-binding protein Mx1 isoform X2 [Perognathus longimembris pacificus]
MPHPHLHQAMTSSAKPAPLSLRGDASAAEESRDTVADSNLCRQYEERVRPCIDLIDSLRALGVEKDLALPAIAVIGDQSSGKSSVLEALSGVALPRGSGIVTRCPLVLRLKKLRQEEPWRAKISYHNNEVEITDAAHVEKEINKAQMVIAGHGVGISDELINLEVSAPHVPDLTLIDLPGITRVAVGSQPADIGHQIKRLIRTYIQKQETINLVVVPCNVDIATTEALSMAQEVDPEGDRTIGILTKPDLVDKGTEDKVVDVVHNLVCHLKKGYMVVKCRGQQDILNHTSPAEALQKERAFFEDHPHFRALLEDGKATVPCLAGRLTSELIAHICKSLPLLEEQIKENHQRITEELQKYGIDIPDDENEKTFYLIEKLNAFNRDITALMEGEEMVKDQNTRLFTKLRNEFREWSTRIENNFKKGFDTLHKKIWAYEQQYRGRELPGFINYRMFESITKEQIKGLEGPAVDMMYKISDLVCCAFTKVSDETFDKFFNLHRTTKNKIEDIRVEQENAAEECIRLHFRMEQIVYCQDHVYREALRRVKEEDGEEEDEDDHRRKPKHLNDHATKNSAMAEILQHLRAYHQDAHNRLASHIPLAIQYFVLQTFGQRLQKSVLLLLQDRESFGWLLRECSDTSEKRKNLKEKLARLAKARARLARFPG